MKIDAEVKMLFKIRNLEKDEQVFITIDVDCISNWDEATRAVEDGLWRDFGINAVYGHDFEICNQNEIEETLVH